MSKDLEHLVREAESDISKRGKNDRVRRREKSTLPKISVALGIWLITILIGIFQFDNIKLLVAKPAESKIEQDLESILETAAGTLRTYEINNGVLPPILPNPSIRGLVTYERKNDFSFRLAATISNVTMVMDSSSTRPYREGVDR